MKVKTMTLQQAVEYLSANGLQPFTLPTLRSAVRAKRLPAQLVTTAPVRYYVVKESDLIEWATNEAAHRPGKKPGKGE